MKRPYLLLLAGALAVQNCKEDCYQAPEPVVFEFVNASGENLIQNGTLTKTKIIVQQDNGNGNSAGIDVEIRDNQKAVLKNAGLFDGTRNYQVYLNTDPIRTFNFKVSSGQLTGDCTGYKINNLTIENITWSSGQGYYRIVVD